MGEIDWSRDGSDMVAKHDCRLIFQHQQSLGGACGICGDPYDASPREHEAGGTFANGIITGTYQQGGVLSVSIELTGNAFENVPL